ncbi:two-component system sensor histidine kinase DesK [Nocardiopsis sp. Huas11]|uniref:sensor histidine kinase n=1 Tax=Nocardiopsis sp. Huas11 TaxID=2183912 RepID=UPI000EB3E4BF|nr:histidine kinase [Nocardiopsis sp. Huas11]RKS07177.1 two-component system sensor histidine kinase DesK [Nocardiopsis sp. Huas11]
MTSEHAGAAPEHLRAVSRSIVIASLSAVGALLVSIDARTWQEAALLAPGLVAALVAVSSRGRGHASRVLFPCLAVAAVVWLLGVVLADLGTASFGLGAVGTLAVLELPRHRRATVLGLSALFLAGPVVKLVLGHQDVLGVLLRFVLVAGCIAVVAVVLTYLDRVVGDLVTQLEASRERDAELAVARERVRFAGDLHDIQGHTLHVVKLKAVLAGKLVHADADRAEEELREIHALVGDTIDRTRELAYAQRRLNLSAELENAKNLFEAAGIDVRVDREADVDTRAGELLGQVLRETTTNILRHAQAERARITLAGAGIRIVNDGASGTAPPDLAGLAALRERVEGAGGELTVERGGGRFVTAAAFPRLTSDRPGSRGTWKDDR